ncbi:MAG: glycosyltransferase family 2 protein [Opitutaceae bacterium]|nr:glycosyltransferase family 2 protein [Cytophagales bacterium]
MIDLSLVIPCYNEEQNIPLIFKRILEIIPADITLEVILVNNGSKDQTKSVILDQIQKSNPVFVLCDVPINIGYGHGILSGLAIAKGKVLSWTHADMQTDPEDVIKAYRLYKSLDDPTVFIKGERKNRAVGPNFFTWGMSVIATLALKVTLTDIGAQPKLFNRAFYEKHLKTGAPVDFSLDLYAMFYAKKYGRIETFPVYFANRAFGEAKGGGSLKTRIKVTKRVLNFIFELKRKVNI